MQTEHIRLHSPENSTEREAIPPAVAAGIRLDTAPALGNNLCVRIENFLRPHVAEGAYHEMLEKVRYEREDIASLTRMWRAKLTPANDLETIDGTEPVHTLHAARLFRDAWFLSYLSRVVGETVHYLEAPKLYRLEHDDRVWVHDDQHDSAYRFAATFHFAKGWRRSDGANFVIGRVARRRPLPQQPDCPLNLVKIYLSRERYVLTPNFNSLVVFRLSNEMGHGVTPMKATNRVRMGLVALLGNRPPRNPPVETVFGYKNPRTVGRT